MIFAPASYVDPLPIVELFPKTQPLHLEIGAGDGSFLVAYAQAHPELNFLGLERLLGRLRKIEKKSRRAKIENVRLLRLEAGYFVKFLLPPASLEAVHIYFPDPWPKRRHRKNRLIQSEFIQDLHRVLRPGGHLHLRTDDADYFTQMQAVLAAALNFAPLETPPALLATVTDFEREFHRRGTPTLHASYFAR